MPRQSSTCDERNAPLQHRRRHTESTSCQLWMCTSQVRRLLEYKYVPMLTHAADSWSMREGVQKKAFASIIIAMSHFFQ